MLGVKILHLITVIEYVFCIRLGGSFHAEPQQFGQGMR